MQILRSGTRVNVTVNNPDSPKRSITFTFDSPVTTGEQLLHQLNTLTPVVLAKNLNGDIVTNVYVTPATDNPFYDTTEMSILGFSSGSTFTGTITLSEP